MIAAYAACGLGVLAKGPVGFMLPWLFFIFWTGHEAASGRRPEWRHLLWGVPITLIPVILWLIPACASGGWEYTQTILIKQNLGRAVNSFAHAEPWYSYLVDFPAIALPWSIAFIGTVPAIIQSVRNKDRNILFCVLWFSTVFIFFTLISGKRSRYIVPLLPAYSIMLSYSITYTQNSRIQRVLIDAVNTLIILTAASFLLFPFFQPFLAQYIHELHGFGENMPWWRVVFLYAGGLLSLFIIFYKYTIFRNFDPAKRIYIASTAFIILFICAQLYYFPALDHIKSARYAAEDICRIKPEDAQVSFWKGRYNEGWNYYLQQDQIPVLNEKTVQPAVHRVILAKADYDKQPLLSAGYGAVRSYQVGSDDFRLYVKR
jgi:4-amino-4-deoxy-L-arabinose transferase-like glycosyltransferase